MGSGGAALAADEGVAVSVLALLNHTAKVWRPSESVGSMRTVLRGYTLSSTVRVAVNRAVAPLGDPGPGLTPEGGRVLYSIPGWDIRPGDVLQLTEGPDAPGQWEVDEPPTRPRGNHLELRCRAYAGKLPGDG